MKRIIILEAAVLAMVSCGPRAGKNAQEENTENAMENTMI